jgi:hypothetical protein
LGERGADDSDEGGRVVCEARAEWHEGAQGAGEEAGLLLGEAFCDECERLLDV